MVLSISRVLQMGLKLLFFCVETGPQQYKVSLRSRKIVDVSQVAVYFGGGGHVRAAADNHVWKYS